MQPTATRQYWVCLPHFWYKHTTWNLKNQLVANLRSHFSTALRDPFLYCHSSSLLLLCVYLHQLDPGPNLCGAERNQFPCHTTAVGYALSSQGHRLYRSGTYHPRPLRPTVHLNSIGAPKMRGHISQPSASKILYFLIACTPWAFIVLHTTIGLPIPLWQSWNTRRLGKRLGQIRRIW